MPSRISSSRIHAPKFSAINEYYYQRVQTIIVTVVYSLSVSAIFRIGVAYVGNCLCRQPLFADKSVFFCLWGIYSMLDKVTCRALQASRDSWRWGFGNYNGRALNGGQAWSYKLKSFVKVSRVTAVMKMINFEADYSIAFWAISNLNTSRFCFNKVFSPVVRHAFSQ